MCIDPKAGISTQMRGSAKNVMDRAKVAPATRRRRYRMLSLQSIFSKMFPSLAWLVPLFVKHIVPVIKKIVKVKGIKGVAHVLFTTGKSDVTAFLTFLRRSSSQ